MGKEAINRIERINSNKLTLSNRNVCTLPCHGKTDFPTEKYGLKGTGQEEINHLIYEGYFSAVAKPIKVAGSEIPTTKKTTKK